MAAGLWRSGARCQLWPPFLETIDARVVPALRGSSLLSAEVSDVQKRFSQSSDGSGGPFFISNSSEKEGKEVFGGRSKAATTRLHCDHANGREA